MSSWQEDRASAKAKRRGIVDQRPGTPKAKKKPVDKPWVVLWVSSRHTRVFGRYRTQEEAQRIVDKEARRIFAHSSDGITRHIGLRLRIQAPETEQRVEG